MRLSPTPLQSPDSSVNLKKYLASRQKLIDHALDGYLPKANTKPVTIHKAMRYSLFAGGKRLRPILCLAAAEACGGKIENAMPLACAMECIHTYSLVHDDLPSMDNDDFRRGRLTCHKVFGDGIAVLAGDALLTIAFEIVSHVKPTRRYDMSTLFREVAVAAGSRKLIAGQVADLEAEGKPANRALLRYIHENKTAAILTASVCLGAMSAEATNKELASNHKIRARARSGISGDRRHSRCHADERKTRQKRRQRYRSAEGDISVGYRIERFTRRGQKIDPSSPRCVVDLRPERRNASRAR